jgi:hypothetical protein
MYLLLSHPLPNGIEHFNDFIGMDNTVHKPNNGVKHKVRILFGLAEMTGQGRTASRRKSRRMVRLAGSPSAELQAAWRALRPGLGRRLEQWEDQNDLQSPTLWNPMRRFPR